VKPWLIAVQTGAAGWPSASWSGIASCPSPAEVRVSPSPVRVVETVIGVPEGCQTAIDHLEAAYQALVEAKDHLVDAFNDRPRETSRGAATTFGAAGQQASAANDQFVEARDEAAACLTAEAGRLGPETAPDWVRRRQRPGTCVCRPRRRNPC
jgi:hypothetical protein